MNNQEKNMNRNRQMTPKNEECEHALAHAINVYGLFFLLFVGFLICCVLHLLIPRRHNHVIDMPDKRLTAKKKNERQPRSLVGLLSSMYVCLLDWMILKFMWVRCVVTHNPNRLTFRIFGIEHFLILLSPFAVCDWLVFFRNKPRFRSPDCVLTGTLKKPILWSFKFINRQPKQHDQHFFCMISSHPMIKKADTKINNISSPTQNELRTVCLNK